MDTGRLDMPSYLFCHKALFCYYFDYPTYSIFFNHLGGNQSALILFGLVSTLVEVPQAELQFGYVLNHMTPTYHLFTI